MQTSITEISPSIYRLTLAPNAHFEFSQYLLVSDKVCLVHAGKSELFRDLYKMVRSVLGDRVLDYIVFSHVEADETGALQDWLSEYPSCQVVCNKVANINLKDLMSQPCEIVQDLDVLPLGDFELQLINTPHFPHNWDAHMWLEKKTGSLFSSDFCCTGGTERIEGQASDVDDIIAFYERGGFIPYGKTTNENLDKLSRLNIENIFPMHGPIYKGSLVKAVLQSVTKDLKQKSL